MKVLFERKFHKDIDALSDKELKKKIEQIILLVEKANNFSLILNIKKLKGHKSAYRLRLGDYRLGFFFENKTIIFSRFMNRKDIYKYFP